jgi:hypothetical protein
MSFPGEPHCRFKQADICLTLCRPMNAPPHQSGLGKRFVMIKGWGVRKHVMGHSGHSN